MRGELSAMGLGPGKVFTPIRLLSGGERVRLVLTRLVLQRPHLLILDEPSNHLDLDSVHALGVGLGAKWDGAVVLATHDSNLVRLVCDTKGEGVNYWCVAEVDESIGLGYERSVRR
jgi:ATP-binding cassette subfamily F protein 3